MPRSIICINNFRHLPSIIVHLTNRFAKLGLRNSTHLIKNQCGFIWNTNFFVLLTICHGDTVRDMCNMCNVHHKRPLFKLSKSNLNVIFISSTHRVIFKQKCYFLAKPQQIGAAKTLVIVANVFDLIKYRMLDAF